MPKSSTNHQSLITKLTWLPKKTFELEFTIPWMEVQVAYNNTLQEVAKATTLKGFRQGKAPLSLVEKSLDKEKLFEQTLNKLLPLTYEKAAVKHNLKPIISPKVQPVSVKEGSDWQFKATACERPEIKLGDYEAQIKGEMAKNKIWLPHKDKAASSDKPDKKPSYDEKLKVITEILLKTCALEVPDLLIDDEVNRMLTRLVDQLNSLKMTIEDYLASKGQNSALLRDSYRKQAETTLKIEFILQEIVLSRKIQAPKEDIDRLIQAAPDEKVRQKLSTPLERAYLGSLLAKRKALDYLESL